MGISEKVSVFLFILYLLYMKKIIRLTENDLYRIVRQVINEEPISNNVLNKYLITKPKLIPLYQEIERVLGDKFTEKHFIDEIKYSGGLKELSGGLLPKTINSFKSNNLSLKYQRFAPSGCKDIGIRRFEFVAKTQVLNFYIIQKFCLIHCKEELVQCVPINMGIE